MAETDVARQRGLWDELLQERVQRILSESRRRDSGIGHETAAVAMTGDVGGTSRIEGKEPIKEQQHLQYPALFPFALLPRDFFSE